MANRESWYALNISTKVFSLGDLPNVPTFAPDSNYDLLTFEDKEKILQSNNLVYAVAQGWIQFTIVQDGVSTIVDPDNFAAILSASVGVVVPLRITVDGGGSAITAGSGTTIYVPVASAGSITGYTLIADQSGSISIAISKCAGSTFPSGFTSIVASSPPTLSGAQYQSDSTLTGWTTSVATGDVLKLSVTSASTVTRVTLTLQFAGI
jgi:hypothetical protein